jgi:hypothetical protein
LGLTLALGALAPAADAQDAQALASRVSNPNASLISVPIIGTFDPNIGPNDDETRLSFKIQPIIPMSLNADWNLITPVIVPIVARDDIFPGARDQFGLGDTTVSLFFSPVQPTFGSLIWGVGPVFLVPTAADDLPGNDRWGRV